MTQDDRSSALKCIQDNRIQRYPHTGYCQMQSERPFIWDEIYQHIEVYLHIVRNKPPHQHNQHLGGKLLVLNQMWHFGVISQYIGMNRSCKKVHRVNKKTEHQELEMPSKGQVKIKHVKGQEVDVSMKWVKNHSDFNCFDFWIHLPFTRPVSTYIMLSCNTVMQMITLPSALSPIFQEIIHM